MTTKENVTARSGYATWQSLTKTAFTIAEVLITLVIIGIIAAITVPVIHANYKKQETVSKLKKAYSILVQAINRSQFENGSIVEWYENNKSSKSLFDVYFKPYVNAKVIDNYLMAGYKSRTPYIALNKSLVATGIEKNESRIPFMLSDGTFIFIVTMINNNGTVVVNETPKIYIDINGGKNPNQFGKDVFLMLISPTKGPIPQGQDLTTSEVNGSCSKNASGSFCLEKIIRDGWEIKSDYPW